MPTFNQSITCCVCGALVLSEFLGQHHAHAHAGVPMMPSPFWGQQVIPMGTSTSSSTSTR